MQQHPQLKRLSSELALRYAHNELVTDDQLRAIGEALWQSLNLQPAFDALCASVGRQIIPLTLVSEEPAILQLPWETLHHPEQGFLALEPGFALSRAIPSAPNDQSEIEPGPLRVLLFTAITEDQTRLDVEQEQAQVQEALLPLIEQGLVQLEMPNDGRFSTLQETLKAFQPHLLFLSGHGKYHDRTLLDQPSYQGKRMKRSIKSNRYTVLCNSGLDITKRTLHDGMGIYVIRSVHERANRTKQRTS